MLQPYLKTKYQKVVAGPVATWLFISTMDENTRLPRKTKKMLRQICNNVAITLSMSEFKLSADDLKAYMHELVHETSLYLKTRNDQINKR